MATGNSDQAANTNGNDRPGTRRVRAANGAKSDRLVSEAVMAGLDSVSADHARVAVGARVGPGARGGGGGLPDAPSDEGTETDKTTGLPAEPALDTESRIEVPEPGTDDTDLDAAIAKREPKSHPLVAFGATMNRFVGEAGEMTSIGGQMLKSAIIHPKGYWGDVKDQIFDGMKLCWLPMIFAVMCFGFGAPGLQGGNILSLFGVPDRLGGFFMFASIREFAPFVEAMVVAGVVGTAITADLGARRIREEIDAMEVLGVDPVRKLMLPRVISTTILTAFFDLFALTLGIVSGYLAGLFLGSSPSGFVASFFSQSNISDDWGSFVKSAVFGLIIGLVCSYKGYRAKGGPAGVGRAVNQAVVVSFALIWVVDYAFTNLLLGYAPSTQVIK
ncbi:MAG: MlaE family ABC transporter permease [Acidimicrobiales bacterium]